MTRSKKKTMMMKKETVKKDVLITKMIRGKKKERLVV